ncbi:phosphofurin acidic cluster sorting protein 2-like isoform X4 [Ruditapes philippinarum]|uniref:phosphofurin acidic cluster sorting protein 2-like isoform X4 n=1 Tax=Ruditapes philippinarum TaxID=129788 RepID=UPI00295B5678|nr:phosphofurin acidic cluster sorting protein 2-like isoform X4 [Ruditapes philippinarum]
MADKNKNLSVQNGQKVISMKLFATWEVEKSSPNCIARICSLRLTRLIVLKPLENELTSVIIAMKMQSSKRVLRSNEIEIPRGDTADVQLDLSFMLQYPHFLKRDGNKLQVMLQRRKRYKNRPIIGYKTLAVGQLSMAEVLQHTDNREMALYTDIKDHKNVVAKVTMLNISSSPVDHEENQNGRRKMASDADRSPDIDVDSEDDENEEDQENWSNDELSDSEPMMLEDGHSRQRKVNRSKVRPAMNRQRNLKQKFVALLKRFKISEEVLDVGADHEMLGDGENPADIDDLIEELEELSDSEPELDTMSVMSTPKPRLRPFFTGQGSTNEIDRQSLTDLPSRNLGSDDSSNSQARNHRISFDELKRKERDTDPETSEVAMATSIEVPTFNTEHVKQQEPRKALLDQLSLVLGGSDDKLPDSLLLVNTAEWQGQLLVQKLQEKQLRMICTCSDADVRATVNFLVSKIQKFCNYNSRSPHAAKIGIAGGDGFINSVLRPYVEQFSAKSPDWQTYVKFLIIPFGSSAVGKYLAHIDNTYNSLFGDWMWKDTFERTDSSSNKLEQDQVYGRISKYLSSAGGIVQIPIAEAMVMCRGKGSEEESCQVFVPFLCEVKIGTSDVLMTSMDMDDSIPQPSLSSSPPQQNVSNLDKNTPPNSPNVSGSAPFVGVTPPSASGSYSPREYVELQVDYWTMVNKTESSDKVDKSSKKDSNKSSLKSVFKSLQVVRLSPQHLLPSLADNQTVPFALTVVTREKKQKIRIGKKSKEESKTSTYEGISRLICTSKSLNQSLKVTVDGVDWVGVKFFQLSSQWQTHIKHFPVCTFTTDIGPVT